MKRSDKLKPVLNLANDAEQSASRALGRHQQLMEQHQRKLDELKQYRLEYMDGFHSTAKHGLSAAQLADYHVFLSRLDAAIEQQVSILAESEKHRDQSRRDWIDSRQKKQAMEKVVDRHLQREQLLQNRKDQREQDDWAQASLARSDSDK